MPRMESRLVYMDHVVGRGSELFAAVCASDLEGIVANWKHGRYLSDGCTTSWLRSAIPTIHRWPAGRNYLALGRPARARRARGQFDVRCSDPSSECSESTYAFSFPTNASMRRPQPSHARNPIAGSSVILRWCCGECSYEWPISNRGRDLPHWRRRRIRRERRAQTDAAPNSLPPSVNLRSAEALSTFCQSLGFQRGTARFLRRARVWRPAIAWSRSCSTADGCPKKG